MFNKLSIIVTVLEVCREAICDDEAFQPGWPISTLELIGRKPYVSIGYEDHKSLRKITVSPVNGHEALPVYMRYIETNVVETLDKWVRHNVGNCPSPVTFPNSKGKTRARDVALNAIQSPLLDIGIERATGII
nr:ent-kaurenoic acid oxidase [Tanacetum cinerariifolium]